MQINIDAINSALDDRFLNIDEAHARLIVKYRFLRREGIRGKSRKPHERNNTQLNYAKNR